MSVYTSSRVPWDHRFQGCTISCISQLFKFAHGPGEESICSLDFLKVYVYLQMFMYTYACVHMITCVHMIMCRPEVNIVCLPQLLSILIFFPFI